MVPSLKAQSLLSGGKFAEAGYISVCDPNKVNLYDGRTAKMVVSEQAVLTGWRCPVTNLWRVPISPHVTADNLNTHTLLLDGPTGCESLNVMYDIPASAQMLEQIKLFNNDPARPNSTEAINNVYELPSIERAVRYLHGAAGSLLKSSMCSSI